MSTLPRFNELVYDLPSDRASAPLDKLRALFHGSIRELENDHSPIKQGSFDNTYWFTTELPTPFFNQATIYNQDPTVFEEALKRFYELNIVHTIFLAGGGLAHADTLKSRGYVHKSTIPLMAHALDPNKSDFELRSGLEVKRVETEEQNTQANDLLESGFGMPRDLTEIYTNSAFGNPNSYRYILFDEGVPVSTSHFIRTGKFLGCFDVATPPEHQRKGYGDQLMSWALATHTAMGDELVVLQASKAGQNLYRTHNFHFLEFAQGWYMDSTDPMRRFTHDELQLGDFNLRPLRKEDSDWAIAAFNDEGFVQWMGFPSPFEAKDFEATFQRMSRFKGDGYGMNWVIERDGVPQGMIACHHTDWKYKRTEIGYGAFAASRGTGFIPTVLRQLVEFLFREYGFERIEVRTDVKNQPSRRAAEKAGFTFEGELRRNFLNLGEVTDDAIFSVIPSDLNKGGSTQ